MITDSEADEIRLELTRRRGLLLKRLDGIQQKKLQRRNQAKYPQASGGVTTVSGTKISTRRKKSAESGQRKKSKAEILKGLGVTEDKLREIGIDPTKLGE